VKLLKKEEKKWCHELKHATTPNKIKVAKVRAKPKTFGTADLKHTYAMTSLPLE